MKASSKLRRIALSVTSLALATTLASCGGSDDGSSPPPAPAPVPTSNTPPTSASQSVGGFIAYLKILVATAPDTIEPLDLTGFVAPTDDTGPFDTTI